MPYGRRSAKQESASLRLEVPGCVAEGGRKHLAFLMRITYLIFYMQRTSSPVTRILRQGSTPSHPEGGGVVDVEGMGRTRVSVSCNVVRLFPTCSGVPSPRSAHAQASEYEKDAVFLSVARDCILPILPARFL